LKRKYFVCRFKREGEKNTQKALFKLMRDVLALSDQNRMTIQSLATVWSPNIFGRNIGDNNPFAFVQITQTQTEWVQKMLKSRY
jgi:hypothetical protein